MEGKEKGGVMVLWISSVFANKPDGGGQVVESVGLGIQLEARHCQCVVLWVPGWGRGWRDIVKAEFLSGAAVLLI